MSGWRFDPDPAGIRAVSTGPAVADALTEAATEAAGNVKRLGPKRRTSFFDYAAGVKARPAQRGPTGEYEAGVEVDSPGWHLPEYGAVRVPVSAPLRRGVQMVSGIDFHEGE
jgi:bacteriophage HK97-gp10 putative tail-component